jgi:hypothetical protein
LASGNIWATICKFRFGNLAPMRRVLILQPMTEQRIIATFSTYNGTVMAFRDLMAERKIAISGDSVAEVSGLTTRYISKLLGPAQARRIGWESLFALWCCRGQVGLDRGPRRHGQVRSQDRRAQRHAGARRSR